MAENWRECGVEMSGQRQGLTEREAAARLLRDGANELQKRKGRSVVGIFLDQLLDPLIYVLFAAAVVSCLLREYNDAVIIVVVILLNAVVGTMQEGKAKKALEALGQLQSPTAIVIRDGIKKEIPAASVVCGDLVCLEAGARVPADLILVEAVDLHTMEAALTGESIPVLKEALSPHVSNERLQREPGRKDRESILHGEPGKKNMESILHGEEKNRAYLSTVVTSGRGKGIVVATGMRTELGKIADLIHEEKEELTPLQKRLGELGMVLSILSVLLCGGLFFLAVLQKRNVFDMLVTAISLAVAAVPEGLPAVVTICLALSVTRMVREHTIVRRLPSVETLGCVNVVCSDKTGTLTVGTMTARKGFWYGRIRDLEKGDEKPPTELLMGAVLCNDATLPLEKGSSWRQRAHSSKKEGRAIGDPTEIALLALARRFGMEKEEQEGLTPRIDEIAFSSERREMITRHRVNGCVISYCKGAPDVILPQCSFVKNEKGIISLSRQDEKSIQKAIDELSGHAYRLLAVAMREEGRGARPDIGMSWHGNQLEKGETRDGWTFLGLLAMQDPPRPKVAHSVDLLRKAGVLTVMVTGDHAKTAMAMGRQLGIAQGDGQCMTGEELEKLSDAELERAVEERKLRVFARVSPTQKVRIVKSFQKNGGIVAMTGDGVNDAPSLKAADIGIAMGKNGTDVAKQAADLVLTDDHFSTIERAIEEGRGVYENIRKAVIFLLSSNLGELLTMFLSVLLGFAAPLKSAHILWINLITDSLPALALGVDQNDGAELMRNPPRQAKESLFARGGLECTCFYGLLIAGISLLAFFLPVMSHVHEAGNLWQIMGRLKEGLQEGENLLRGQTYTFTVLGMSQLFHAIGMRDVNSSVFQRRQGRNWLMLLAFILGLSLQLLVTEIPFLVQTFGTAHLSLREWGMLMALAMTPLFAHELLAWTASWRKG